MTVDHTLVPSTQSNFTVLVSVTDATLKTTANGGHVANSNGYDIGFYTDSSGSTKLKWEIESYNPVTGQLIAWVKIPTLSSTSDTSFYLFYGDPSITSDQSDPVNTWDSNFKAVYHLGNGMLNSFSARFRFARLGCFAAQVAVAKGDEVMKVLLHKLLLITVLTIAVTSLLCVPPAQAYTVTLKQVGSNVVAHGSGAINLTGLTFISSGEDNPGIVPFLGVISTGPFASNIDVYRGFTGPTDFGSGPGAPANTATGDFVEISGVGLQLFVPLNYVSGAALSDSMTFNNATFASIGATPGAYVWSRGTGLANRMVVRQFLCSASVCSAWLPCGANCRC